jgi:isoquinoline 1-oxidoreductase subunit beta
LKRRGLFLLAGAAAGSSLLVGYGLRPPSAASRLGDGRLMQAQGLEAALNGWVKIDPQGRVTLAMPRAEMGQGVHTALAQLMAEELDADWAQMSVQDAPVAGIYANQAVLLNVLPLRPDDEGAVARFVRGAAQRGGYALGLQITGGSSSVRDAWGPVRHAGAMARQLLLQAAAARWGVALSQLQTAKGQVLHAGRTLSYGELALEAATLSPPTVVPLKARADWRLIGHSPPRLDLPAKVQGQAQFGVDVRLPGMVYAALRQSPAFGGSVVRFDEAAIRTKRGVQDAFLLNERTAVVVADRWWRAEQAFKLHPPRFHAGPLGGLNTADMRKTLRLALDQRDGTGFRDDGDALAVLADPSNKVLSAEYELPFLAHAAMEPLNCTAQFRNGKLTVWCPTQVASLARWKAAQAVGIDADAVTLHTTYLGGGFGRRLEVEVIEQAAAIAKRLNGPPVKLLWNREEDFTQGVYRPMAVSRFEAAVGADGKPMAWLNKVAGPSVGFDSTGRLFAGWAANTPDKNQIEGAYELPYDIPHLRVRQLRVPLGVPVGSWRSVGHGLNAFFTECFIDELAALTGQDPFTYRDALLSHRPRLQAVLRLAAHQAGWGQALPEGRARGIALHESFGSICAQVAEVSLESNLVRVHRVVLALDAGTLVNPDTVRAQMEGSVIFGLTAALYGEVTVEGGAIQQRNFPQQPLLTLAQTPSIECHFVASQEPPGGVGEPGLPPLAPAVVNALAALTGQRIRRLPIRL